MKKIKNTNNILWWKTISLADIRSMSSPMTVTGKRPRADATTA